MKIKRCYMFFGSRLRFPVKSPKSDDDLLKVFYKKFTVFMRNSLCRSHTC